MDDQHETDPPIAKYCDLAKQRRICSGCGRRLIYGTLCRRRTCPKYGPVWARDVRRVLFENLKASGSVVMTTVTAPGAAVLPWSCERPHKHSGDLGCKVEPNAAHEWNLNARLQWSRLHRRLSQACKRHHGFNPLLLRIWEEQKRGVLHLHVVLAFSPGAEQRAAQLYIEMLSERACEYGFGFVDRKVGRASGKVWDPSAAAAYLSSYYVRGKGAKATINQTVLSDQIPPSVFYVARRLLKKTGVTMRSLRLDRRMWAVELGLIHPPGWRGAGSRWVQQSTGEVFDEPHPWMRFPDFGRPP